MTNTSDEGRFYEGQSGPWDNAPPSVQTAFTKACAALELAGFYAVLLAVHDDIVRQVSKDTIIQDLTIQKHIPQGSNDTAMLYHPPILREYLLSEMDRYQPAFLLGDFDTLLRDYRSERDAWLRSVQSWVLGFHGAMTPCLWPASIAPGTNLPMAVYIGQRRPRVDASDWRLFATAMHHRYIHPVNQETLNRPLELVGAYDTDDLEALFEEIRGMIMPVPGKAGVAYIYHFNWSESHKLIMAAQKVVSGPPVPNLSDAILDAAYSAQEQAMMRRDILIRYADAEGWTGAHLARVWRERGLIGPPRRQGEDYDEEEAQKSAERVVRQEKARRRSGKKRRF